MGYLDATLTQVFTRVHGADLVTHRCHNSPDGKQGYEVWMTSRTESARRILEILKKVSGDKNWTPNEKGWLSLAHGGLGQLSHKMGGRWKSQNRNNVYLSPCVEEPLNSKVIKSFVPELRSRYVFFEFRDSYVLSLWTFDVRFIHSHIMAMVQYRIWH